MKNSTHVPGNAKQRHAHILSIVHRALCSQLLPNALASQNVIALKSTLKVHRMDNAYRRKIA